MVKLNAESIALLKQNEGLRLTAYYDTVGVLTIGYGSARTFRGRRIYEGMTITEEEAELALQEDISKYQTFLTYFKRSFNANQIGALTSFEYNVGSGTFANDGWSPTYSDAEILASLNNYRRPPEISSRRDREIAFYKKPVTDNSKGSEYVKDPENRDPKGDTPPVVKEDKETPEKAPNISTSESEISEEMKKFLETVIKKVEDLLSGDVYQLKQGQFYSNDWLKVEKTYNNTFKVSLSQDVTDKLKGTITTDTTGEKEETVQKEDKKDEVANNPNPQPSAPPSNNTSGNELAKKLYDWANARQGQSFDFDGHYGAQCVDLVTWLNSVYKLGLNCAGMYAKDIYNNPVPSGWKKVVGNPANDSISKGIWNSLPDGAIVWFTNPSAGHVGLKAGEWAITLNQNVDDPEGRGGPIRKSQLQGWIEGGGAGFLGAWVPE